MSEAANGDPARIDYSFTVTNRGNITVENIKVTDPALAFKADLPLEIPFLAPGDVDDTTFALAATKEFDLEEDLPETFTSQSTALGWHRFQPFIRHRVITEVKLELAGDQTAPVETSGFGQWQSEHGLPEEKAGPLDDASGDGVNNLLKYAFGLDPISSSRAGLPVLTVEENDGDRYLFLTVTKNPDAADIEYLVESSADGITWVDDSAKVVIVEETESILRARLAQPIGESPKAFLRVKLHLYTVD